MARNRYDVDESMEEKPNFRKLSRAFVYLKPFSSLMIVALLCTAAASVLTLLPTKFLETAMNEAIPDADIRRIVKLGLLAVLVTVVSSLLGAVRGIIMARVGQNMIYNIRSDVFNHLQALPFSYYDSRPHGKILVRVVNYVNSVSDTLSNGMINMIVQLLTIVFIVCFMFATNVQMTLYILAGLPLLIAVLWVFKKWQMRANRISNNKISNLTAYTCESIQGVKVSQTFNRKGENERIFAQLNDEYQRAWYKMAYTSNMVSPVVEIIKQLVVTVVYIAGVLLVTDRLGLPIAVGTVVAMATYASRFWAPIIQIANLYNNFITAASYLERVFQTLDEPVDIADGADSAPLPDMKGDVEFRHVSFCYEPGHPVLRDVNFHAAQGKSFAFVGETGSGKSTIVSLISRFYNVSEGEVLIDGVNVNHITLQSLRSQMGIMLQDSFIFSGTVADNVRYGRLDATDEDVRAACVAVGADGFISEMPEGYKTVISENGGSLSQGQKQLLAFARTMISNPKIVVLDEATSALDAKTERLLQLGIAHLLEGRTSFIIAHRLSTIRRCDDILYIENGQIVEHGTHEELMAQHGRYYRLCTVQGRGAVATDPAQERILQPKC